MVPKIVCSLLTSHNFDHYANSHSLYPPLAAVVFLALSLRREVELSRYNYFIYNSALAPKLFIPNSSFLIIIGFSPFNYALSITNYALKNPDRLVGIFLLSFILKNSIVCTAFEFVFLVVEVEGCVGTCGYGK